MKNLNLLVAIVLVLMLSSSCSNAGQSRFQSTEDFKVFRDYRLITEDNDPHPAWSPNDYRIIVRSKRGLGLLDEGAENQKFYNTKDLSKIGWPTWLDNSRIVVGSPEFMAKTEDGGISQSHVKLRLLSAKGMHLEEKGFIGDINAYFPRARSKSRLFAQKSESVIEVHLSGEWEEYDQGFYAVPQFNGPGVCIQTVPIHSKDYWTGKKDNGELVIRWSEGDVALFPDCFQAQWCENGGVIATRLKGSIHTVKNWRELDSDIVYIAPRSKQAVVVKEHAHSPAANPVTMVAACVGRAGFLYITDIKANAVAREVVPEGEKPQWSFDGRRLLTEVPGLDSSINLRIWVFNHQNDVAQ